MKKQVDASSYTTSRDTTVFDDGDAVRAIDRRSPAVLLREVLDATGIVLRMTAQMKVGRRQADVVHDLPSLVRTMVLLAAHGWRGHDDADALRHDPAMRLAVSSSAGLTPLADDAVLASQPTLSRCTAMLAQPENIRVLREAALELAGRNLRVENGGALTVRSGN